MVRTHVIDSYALPVLPTLCCIIIRPAVVLIVSAVPCLKVTPRSRVTASWDFFDEMQIRLHSQVYGSQSLLSAQHVEVSRRFQWDGVYHARGCPGQDCLGQEEGA